MEEDRKKGRGLGIMITDRILGFLAIMILALFAAIYLLILRKGRLAGLTTEMTLLLSVLLLIVVM